MALSEKSLHQNIARVIGEVVRLLDSKWFTIDSLTPRSSTAAFPAFQQLLSEQRTIQDEASKFASTRPHRFPGRGRRPVLLDLGVCGRYTDTDQVLMWWVGSELLRGRLHSLHYPGQSYGSSAEGWLAGCGYTGWSPFLYCLEAAFDSDAAASCAG